MRIGQKLSEEHRRKLSEAHKGKPSSRLGVKLSEETRRKLSEAMKGRKAWNRGKTSWSKGRHLSEEHRKKIGEGNKGKKPSREAIRLSMLTCSKVVLAYTLSGDFVREFPSTVQASVELGCTHGSVANCCRGIKPTCKGYILKYKEDVNG